MNEAAQEHETKWTPGPWGFEGAGLDKYYEVAPFGKDGVLDWDREVAATDGNIWNAHLIAAAPRLYAALYEAAHLVHFGALPPNSRSSDPFETCEADCCKTWRALLAEARGEVAP